MHNESIPARMQPQERAARTAPQPAQRPGERPGLWTVEDVAQYLQIPLSSVYRMTARKARLRIPHIRLGSNLRFRQADIDQWLSLLTVSNLDALRKLHDKARQATHGKNPQAEASLR